MPFLMVGGRARGRGWREQQNRNMVKDYQFDLEFNFQLFIRIVWVQVSKRTSTGGKNCVPTHELMAKIDM